MIDSLPFYQPIGNECEVFQAAMQQKLPLLLKGPTGCGKSRFIEHMAAKLGRPLVTVACNEDTGATDLLGRHLIKGGETVWCDGPLTRSVRTGSILYLDEIAEARPDTLVIIHPLTDHRRSIYLDRLDQELRAPQEFMLVASFNPGYQNSLKELKPSTRQRFLGLTFDFPPPEAETEIIFRETGVDRNQAQKLVRLALKLRAANELALSEAPSTRLLVNAAKLIACGTPPRSACSTAIVHPLTDDIDIARAMHDLASLIF